MIYIVLQETCDEQYENFGSSPESQNNFSFEGAIDEVEIFNRALTSDKLFSISI